MTETSLENSRLFCVELAGVSRLTQRQHLHTRLPCRAERDPLKQVCKMQWRTSTVKCATSNPRSQRYLFFLKLLTFIGKLSFWGVRWCVIVSTADFATDTPLLVRHVNWTHPESVSLWLAANQIHRSRWPRPVWNTRPVNPQSTSHLFRFRRALTGGAVTKRFLRQNTL